MFRESGVPLPVGSEDVRSVDDVLAAIAAVRAERPLVGGVVLKLDDSGAGDGNVVLDLRTPGELRTASMHCRTGTCKTWPRGASSRG